MLSFAGHVPAAVSVADFNGDGKPDLVVSNLGHGNEGSLSILLGNGDGTFQTPRFLVEGAYPFATTGDFNGDGIPDLAVSHTFSTLILLGNGGKLDLAALTGTTVSGNGAGKPDLVIGNGSDAIAVLTNTLE